jgi:hypothetical protein
MKITFDDLRSYGLYENLPNELKELESSEDAKYFIFYYEVDEANLRLKIFEYNNVKETNISLYRGISDKARKYNSNLINLGFFKKTFETKDGIFYQFLRTYNESESVKKLYDNAIKVDRDIEASISTNAITEIYNADNFRRAISYFNHTKLQSIMAVYDMVDEAMSKKVAKRLYADSLKKVVSIVRFDGGVLPEIGGYLRFMVIGENAKLTSEQKENLELAKALLRSYVPIDTIYQKTGWAFAEWDGKWRTNIADNDAKILEALLFDYNGRKLFIPMDTNQSTVVSLLENPSNLYKINYKGKLSDVLEHPTLYKYYPQLASTPLLYYFGNNESGLKPTFYYSPNNKGGYIVICGFPSCGDSLSILLHEIQHAIQNKENFSTGGNEFLASFVAALGGKEVRKIFSSINKVEKYFNDYFNNDESRLEIKKILNTEMINSSEAEGIKNQLFKLLENYDVYSDSLNIINFYVILFIAENGDYATNGLTNYLVNKVGYVIYEIFENITIAYNEALNYKEKLSSEGYKKEDINRILYSSYENLYGETESRATQSSRYLGSEYKNYFYLNGWENGALKSLVVIDGIDELVDSSNIKAAVEFKDGEYVLHFEKNRSCEPFLHELGHIVYDCLIKLGYGEEIKKIFDFSLEFTTETKVEDKFVNSFLAYIRDVMDDKNIKSDLLMNFSIQENKQINSILDEFFRDSEINERTKFVKYMLEII